MVTMSLKPEKEPIRYSFKCVLDHAQCSEWFGYVNLSIWQNVLRKMCKENVCFNEVYYLASSNYANNIDFYFLSSCSHVKDPTTYKPRSLPYAKYMSGKDFQSDLQTLLNEYGNMAESC